jgi:hypothetical protein
MSREAMVVGVHPSRRTADIVYCDTGMPVAEVKIAGSVSSDGGSWNVPSVKKPASLAQAASPPATGRRLIALVDSVGVRPVITGFVAPSGGQMTFAEQDREVHRHSSGAYTTISPSGDIETFHPSGAYFRIGNGPHEPLAAVAPGWVETTSAPPPTVTLATPQFTLTVDPGGNVSLRANGTLGLSSAGTMTLESDAGIVIVAPTIQMNP